MKRTSIAVALILAVLVFSCQKKADSPVEAEAEGSEGTAEGETPAQPDSYGYTLRIGVSVYTLETDTGEETDRTKWATSLPLGERVDTGAARRATFGGDGKVYGFVEIRREGGGKFYAFASQVSAGGSLAAVIDAKANLYRSPKSVDVTGTILPRGIVGVCFPETERDGFIEIRAYDPEVQTYRHGFLRVSSISRQEPDIQSSILLQTALPLKNEGAEKIRRDALLENAIRLYPGSVFHAGIQALMYPPAAAPLEEAGPEVSGEE